MDGSRQFWAVFLVSTIFAFSSPATADPFFKHIGRLNGTPTVLGQGVLAAGGSLSADGKVIAGTGVTAGSFSEAFRWTEETGFLGLGVLPGSPPRQSSAFGTNGDGSVVVGNTTSGFFSERAGVAYRWTQETGLVNLGDLPGGIKGSRALGVSNSGDVVVGEGISSDGTEAFRWTETSGMVGLGDLPGGVFVSRALAASADGSVVVGRATSDIGSEAFRWTESTGMVGLGSINNQEGFAFSEAFNVSSNGEFIVGRTRGELGTVEAFRWTEAEGFLSLGDVEGNGIRSDAFDVSANGSVIVGSSKTQAGTEAVIWDPLNGMQRVSDVLENVLGLDLEGSQLLAARSISDDGTIIAGDGITGNGVREVWIADISGALAPPVEPEIVPLAIGFNDPTPTEADQFGQSVSLADGRVLIGAPDDDTDKTIGGNVTNAGQAHLFDSLGNLQQTFINPTPAQDDEFGFSVAHDGNLALIGERADDTAGVDVGQAHLFDTETGNLIHTLNDPTPTNADNFGFAVALDKTLAVVGAPGDDTVGAGIGQVHLFDTNTSNLLLTLDDPTPTNLDSFGQSVAIDRGLILVGAPGDDTNGILVGQAHLFDASDGTLIHTFDDPDPTNEDQFGAAVSVVGNLVLIGAPNDDTHGENTGQAYLFDATTADLIFTFSNADAEIDDHFGASVGASNGFAVVGAPDAGASGNSTGQVHVFDTVNGTQFRLFEEPNPSDNDRFGTALSVDRDKVIVGAPGDSTLGIGVGQAHLLDMNQNIISDGSIGIIGEGEVYSLVRSLRVDGILTNSGTLKNDEGRSLVIDEGGTLNGGGTYSQGLGALVVNGNASQKEFILDGGVLRGAGTMTGNVIVGENARVVPGNSPGTITVKGDVTVNDGALIQLEFGDLIQITGTLEVGPGVIIELVFGDVPLPPVIDMASFFDVTNASDPNLDPIIEFLSTDITVFTDDGDGFGTIDVDVFGTLIQVAVKNSSNASVITDPADSASIPEPSTFAVFGFGLFGLRLLRRRHGHSMKRRGGRRIVIGNES